MKWDITHSDNDMALSQRSGTKEQVKKILRQNESHVTNNLLCARKLSCCPSFLNNIHSATLYSEKGI
jgi:hypothetical protein